MDSRIGINKFMNMGKEAKFVIFAGAALLTAMLLPLIEVYWWGVTLSVSAVVAMLMALYRVRLWVRLLAMPVVLMVALVATVFVRVVVCGSDTGSGDADKPWICPLLGLGVPDPDGRASFPVPDYLPFINEMPELLLASIIQLGVFAAAVRSGRNREAGCQDK